MNVETVRPSELIARLESLRAGEPSAALAFDGDGTLWSGDVGEDVFHHLVNRRLLREAALPALRQAAEQYGIPCEGDANAVAARIFAAYVAGKYPERETCAMMTWCYAGFTVAEFREHCREVLADRDLDGRLQRELEPVITHARAHGVRVVVVSASPRVAVETAAERWSIPSEDVAASTPLIADGEIADRSDGDVPYAEGKVGAARALFGDALWLASFGDNVFDVEMFQAARIGVAVRPKLALQRRLPELERVVLLESPGSVNKG